MNGRDADDKTPLVHAVENGRGTMAAALLTAGAPPLFHKDNNDGNWSRSISTNTLALVPQLSVLWIDVDLV